MRVVVTGGAGFVGSAIVRAMLDAGDTVSVVDTLETGRLENLARPPGTEGFYYQGIPLIGGANLRFHHADAGQSIACGDVDAIVHCAGYADVSLNWSAGEREKQWEKNVTLVRRVLENYAQPRARPVAVILLSTCAVYPSGRSWESTVPRAASPYAAAKLGAEALIDAWTAAGRIHGMSLRLVSCVGPRYSHGHIRDFVRMYRQTGRISARDNGRKARSMVHVDDVGEFVARAVPWLARGGWSPNWPVVNLTSPYRWSWRDTVACLEHRLRKKIDVHAPEDVTSGWVGDADTLIVESAFSFASVDINKYPEKWPERPEDVRPRSIVRGVYEAIESVEGLER